MDFEVDATPTGDGATTLISVYGELDLATSGQLAPVAEEVRSADRSVILDLERGALAGEPPDPSWSSRQISML